MFKFLLGLLVVFAFVAKAEAGNYGFQSLQQNVVVAQPQVFYSQAVVQPQVVLQPQVVYSQAVVQQQVVAACNNQRVIQRQVIGGRSRGRSSSVNIQRQRFR